MLSRAFVFNSNSLVIELLLSLLVLLFWFILMGKSISSLPVVLGDSEEKTVYPSYRLPPMPTFSLPSRDERSFFFFFIWLPWAPCVAEKYL